MKIVEFANRVDLNEVTHNEPPHLDLHCLHSGLLSSQNDITLINITFEILQTKDFVVCIFGTSRVMAVVQRYQNMYLPIS